MKQSINRVQIIGTLKEMNIKEETTEVTLRGANDVEKKVTCRQISKAEFKNPMFTVEVNGADIGVDFFAVSEKKLDEDGAIIDNPRFKSMETVMNTYIPKIKDAENATRVKVDGTLRENAYADKNNDWAWKSFAVLNGFQITSSGVSEEDIADCEISGVIKNIVPEVRNEEETGRLIIELYTFDNNGVLSPFKFVVESDIADDVNSFYEIGNSVKLYYEVVTKQVGTPKVVGGGFGRRDSKMISGFSVTEYSIFRGEEPFDEENEYYVTVDEVKEAMDARDIMIEKRTQEAKERATNSTTTASPKGASANGGANPFGASTTSSNATARKNPFA